MTTATSHSDGPQIELHGHRGARAVAPENTLAGVAAALTAGVDFVELDVVLSADRIAHVHHDTRLNAAHTTLDGAWLAAPGPALQSLTTIEIAAYDVGTSRPGSPTQRQFPRQRAFPGARIPRLRDVMEYMAKCSPATGINIELKSSPLDDAAPEPFALAAAVLADIDATGFAGPLRVQSFDWRGLAHLRTAAPDLALGILTCANPAFCTTAPRSPWCADHWPHGQGLIEAIAAFGAQIWGPEHLDIDTATIQAAKDCGLQVSTWTVNDADALARADDLNVTAITTDDPAWAAGLLRQSRG